MTEDVIINYAEQLEEAAAGDWSNPELGSHPARIHSMTFLDRFAPTFRKVKKDAVLHVMVRFELFDEIEDEETEEVTVTPVEGRNFLTKVFSFKWADKGHFTIMLASLYPKHCTIKAKPADDVFNKMIGALPNKVVMVNIVSDGDEQEGGAPKYVKIAEVTKASIAVAKLVPESSEPDTMGITLYKDITEEQIRYLKGYEVRQLIEDGENYATSNAKTVLEAIRKEEPDFAVKKESDDKKPKAKPDAKADKPLPKPDADTDVPEDLDQDEEV